MGVVMVCVCVGCVVGGGKVLVHVRDKCLHKLLTVFISTELDLSGPCAVDNGGCPYLCLTHDQTERTCACPDDITSCIEREFILLVCV